MSLYCSSNSDSNHTDKEASSSSKSTGVKRKKYHQKYKKEWETEFRNWLAPGKLDTQAFCKVCNITVNVSSGRLQLVRHQDSNGHQVKSRAVSSQKKITSFAKSGSTLETASKRADLLISAFVAEHNLPFTITEHLPQLISRITDLHSDIGKNIKCSRTKTTALIKNIIGAQNLYDVCQILKVTKFSLIVDESTDIGCTKHLAMVARYFHESRYLKIY